MDIIKKREEDTLNVALKKRSETNTTTQLEKSWNQNLMSPQKI